MCRWFAYISPAEPTLLSDVLLTPANAITKQCSEHYLPYLLPHGKEKHLDTSKDALLRMRNSLLNMDGLGIVWYTPVSSAYNATKDGTRPAMYKSQSPPFNDFNFTSLCENTESKCLFAHIRASSGSAVTPVNCHPFVFGRHVFMHNGVVSDFTKVRRDMTDLMGYDEYEHIRGSTDSEHAAALYMTYLRSSGAPSHSSSRMVSSCAGTGGKPSWEKTYSLEEMRRALQSTVVTILELQKKIIGDGDDHGSDDDAERQGSGDIEADGESESGTGSPYVKVRREEAEDGEKKTWERTPNSLNFCVTDGVKLVACRFRNHSSQEPPSLYWSEFAGRTLNRKYPSIDHAAAAGATQSTTAKPSSHSEKEDVGVETAATAATNPTNPTRKATVYDETVRIGKHTIVSSEPTTFDEKEWHLIKKNCMLLVDESGVETQVPLEYDEALNATG